MPFGRLSTKLSLLVFLAFIWPTGVLLSCSNKNEPVGQADEVARANYLIEQGQTSEAIYVLGERLKRAPNDPRARLLLASAYSSRAGLQLSKYKNFAAEIVRWDQPDDYWPDDESLVSQVAKGAWRLQLIVKAFEAIPVPQGETGYDDLQSALRVLDDAGKLSGGPSIYRALLRTAILKVNLNGANKLRNLRGCEAEASEIIRWLGGLEKSLSLIVSDIAQGVSDVEAKRRLLELSSNLGESLKNGLAQVESNLENEEVWIQLPAALRKVAGVCQ